MSERPNKPPEELRDWKAHKCKTVYRFKVEALTDIDGEACFQIRIDPVPRTPPGPLDTLYYYRIAMRQSDGTLKMVQRSEESGDVVEVSTKFPRNRSRPSTRSHPHIAAGQSGFHGGSAPVFPIMV
jgi:hypothetical protein